jgi:hypothetical protein
MSLGLLRRLFNGGFNRRRTREINSVLDEIQAHWEAADLMASTAYFRGGNPLMYSFSRRIIRQALESLRKASEQTNGLTPKRLNWLSLQAVARWQDEQRAESNMEKSRKLANSLTRRWSR